MTGVARNLVEHINKVKKEDGTGGGGLMREVAIDKRLCGVDDKVRATRHSNAKLTIGKQEFNDLVVEYFHDKGSGKATGGSADTEGAGASEVSGIFVEGNEVVAGEGFMDGGRELVGEDKTEEISEVVEIRMM
jgi:hypothetical protein